MLDNLLMFVMALWALARGGGGGGGGEITSTSPGWRETRPNVATAAAAAAAAQRELERAAAEAEAARRASTTEAPWPQAVPAGLPPFPRGWEPAEPVQTPVRTRAWQLLDELWRRGQGSTRTELTSGQWITYRAEITAGRKRGVVAYRPRRGATAASSPGVARPRLVSTGPERPTLHQGAGMGALAHLAPHVMTVQRKLGLSPDGKFGPATKAAVIALQRQRTATPDGIVGRKTWAQLDATRAAQTRMAV